ncbi:winged helix-turn-helix domain-containing protein [Streptomyces mirabilis]|uniref:winged helix-turn-helix domain-containing protein n=1 Tax=Streptomyces mirabilis TaxID=68239 RepID=UPI0036B1E6F9
MARGPVAHGWRDQTLTLTLGRIKTLIGRRFRKTHSSSAVAEMLHRHGFSTQVPARAAIERDEGAVTGWVKDAWPPRGSTAAALGGRTVFEDEAGFSVPPPTSRTWSKRGPTTVIRVRGCSRGRVSVAALCCCRALSR